MTAHVSGVIVGVKPDPTDAVQRLLSDARSAMIRYGTACLQGNEEGIRSSTTDACAALDRLAALAYGVSVLPGQQQAVEQKCLPDGIRPQILTTLNARQLHQAWQFVNPDAGDADQEESEVSIRWWPGGKNTDGEDAPAGYYAHLTEYPEEGSLYLDPERPIDGVSVLPGQQEKNDVR